ncbi:la-related protein 1C-like [Impatiens glandulifera]|uniref:la-related protein 1C-like n=1 Tax=Impatiens glandulifera TaxID=253017 RepID=UPI001FB07C0C|nr:la-related protein 1C-like [Impatiens glandulifera]
MATSANSVTSNHSPGGDGAGTNSPQAKQGRGAVSPWMQVVRGSESESIVDGAPSSPLSPAKASSTAFSADDSVADAQMEVADNVSGINNAGKKPVWNKPSNGVAEAGAVMGAISWPALSVSARSSPKSSPSDSLKIVTDGLVSPSQGTGTASPVSQKKSITNNANVSLTSNHGTPTRQKSMKRGGGSFNSGGLQLPQPTLESGVEMSSPGAGKSNSAVVEPSHSKEATNKESGQKGGGGIVSQSPGGNDHPPPQRNLFRRGNGGSHPRGDGSYHHNNNNNNNHGGRREHDWNHHRSFNGRDMQMQSPRGGGGGVHRGFMRNPPPNTAFVPPPPPPLHVRPFGGPVVYSEVGPSVIYMPAPSPESLRGVPVPLVQSPMSPHPMFYLPDPQLHSRIVSQIDYYFSNENLVKDTFLRMNMDDQGWVPIRLIAGFKKVMMLTDNIQFILDTLHSSTIVEIQGERVRRRNDWSKWIMRPTSSSSSAQISSPQSGGPDMMFTANMHNLTLDEDNGGSAGYGSAARNN